MPDQIRHLNYFMNLADLCYGIEYISIFVNEDVIIEVNSPCCRFLYELDLA